MIITFYTPEGARTINTETVTVAQLAELNLKPETLERMVKEDTEQRLDALESKISVLEEKSL